MRASSLAAGIALVPAALLGQGEVARTCDFRHLIKPEDVAGPLRPRHPDIAYRGMAEHIARDEWAFLLDSIAHVVAVDPVLGAVEKQSLREQLRLASDELVATLSRNRRSTLQGIQTTRFNIRPPTATDPEDRYVLFPETQSPIALASLSPGSRTVVCWTAIAVRRILTAFGELARGNAAASLRESVRRWDNYGSKGYSQLPWELALNSWRYSSRSYDPPQKQWIFLHPALGLELLGGNVTELSDLTRLQTTEVITLEVLGLLGYDKPRSYYGGGSLLVTLADERSVGAGVMLHLSPTIKAGYVYRARDAAGSLGQSVILSADLYQLLSKTPAKLLEWKQKGLAQGVAQFVKPQ